MTPLIIDAGTRVAILAGGGPLPLLIADSVVRRGARVHLVAIEGAAGHEVARYPHTWVNLAQAGRMFRALGGADEAPAARRLMVIAGTVTRPDLVKLRPDLGLVPVLFDLLSFITAGGDDALLTKAIRLFERRGLTVVGVQDVAPELLIGAGTLGRHSPDAAAAADLAVAHSVLAALGDFDVGQGAVVESGRVLAIEGVEGTDRMLARLAGRKTATRAVLLKAPKPRQERRVDLPTIGVRTIDHALAAGIRGVAVVAGASIGLQRAAMIEAADRAQMFVTGLKPAALLRGGVAPGAARHPVVFQIETLGQREARAGDVVDAERGGQAVLCLTPFRTGQAAAIVRGHVLGVADDETVAAFMARQRRQGQWGLQRFTRRRGAIVVRALAGDGGLDAAEHVRLTAEAGFGLLAFVVDDLADGESFRLDAGVTDLANTARLAVVALRFRARLPDAMPRADSP